MPEEVIYIIAGVVVVIGLIMYAVIKYEKKRQEGLQDFALKAGFSFDRKFEPGEELRDFSIFNKGYARKAKNLVSGSRGGVAYRIFDYRYRVGGGNNSRTYHQTVAFARLKQATLPGFTLAPENLFHRLGKKLGMKDIDFEHFPEFSRLYLLRGEDEAAIRQVFKPYILDYFQNQKLKATIEARDNRLIFYKRGKRVKPPDMAAHFDQFRQLTALFDRR
jgi:hypothetical protein